MKTTQVSWRIHGLGCGGGGALTLEQVLARLPGVVEVYVNPATEIAYVEYEPHRTTLRRIAAEIGELGYRPGEPRLV